MKGKKEKNPLLDVLKKYRFNSVLFRNFMIAIFLMMIPLLIVILATKKQMNNIVMQEIRTANEQSLEQTANTLDFVVDQMFSFAYYLSENRTFHYMMLYEGKELEEEYRELFGEKIRFYQQTTEYIDSVYIYLEEQDMVFINEPTGYIGTVSLEKLEDQNWLEAYSNLQDEWFVLETRANNDFYPYYMSMIYPITADKNNIRGCIVVNANIKKIGRVLGDTNSAEKLFFMIDEEGCILYTNRMAFMEKQRSTEELPFLLNNTTEFSSVHIGDTEYLLSAMDGSLGGWRYVLCVSVTEYKNKIDEMNSMIVKIVLLTVIAGLAASYFLAIHSYRPIRHLLEELDKPIVFQEAVLENSQSDESEEMLYKNELQYITQMVKKTRVRNNRLQMESEEWMMKLKNAQLLALQSQMDPHYLYNTLDIINWDAIEQLGYDNSVSNMISALAKFLRISLQRSSYLITVREEIEHAQCYAQILGKRYSEDIKIEWNMQEDVLNYKTIRLSIQPLIENAVNHGLRYKRYRGKIIITGMITGDYLCISVEDDGKGMDESLCKELNYELTENYATDSDHVGIRNVNQRIKILCGDDYGIVVSAGHYGGLLVRMILPKLE